MPLRWLSGGLLTFAAAVVAGVIALRLIVSRKSILHHIVRLWRWAEDATHAHHRYAVTARLNGLDNPLFGKAMAYVSALPSLEDADSASISSSATKPNDFALQLSQGQPVRDGFHGARLSWTYFDAGAERKLELRVRRQDRARVLRPYLQHVEAVAEEIEQRRRELRLFTNSGKSGAWTCTAFTHPATMETFAMDPDTKNRVIADLDAFVKGRSYYSRVGRVWRRSYLLFGPTGTGKTTFAAAMAKLIGYDVYDIDLGRCEDVRELMLRTTPRSLVLVEDLDKYLMANMAAPVLNFMDGVAACCGEERVMVFTMTGGIERLDPAVLRAGRIDQQVYFPMCDFAMFKMIADSHLGVVEHKLFPQVEESFSSAGANPISPAEVSEIMLSNRGSPSRALRAVIGAVTQHVPGVTPRYSSSALRQRPTASGELGLHDPSGSGLSTAVASPLNVNGGLSGNGSVKNSPVQEIKKLYGFIKIKSRKENGIAPVEESPRVATNGRRSELSRAGVAPAPDG